MKIPEGIYRLEDPDMACLLYTSDPIAGLWSRHYRMPDIVLVRNGSRQEIPGRFAPEKMYKK